MKVVNDHNSLVSGICQNPLLAEISRSLQHQEAKIRFHPFVDEDGLPVPLIHFVYSQCKLWQQLTFCYHHPWTPCRGWAHQFWRLHLLSLCDLVHLALCHRVAEHMQCQQHEHEALIVSGIRYSCKRLPNPVNTSRKCLQHRQPDNEFCKITVRL